MSFQDKMADKDHRRIILGLLEKRRHHIREEIGREHPEIHEKLQRRREKLEQRLEKQNPEGGAQTASVGAGASSEERRKQLTGNTLRGRDYAIKSLPYHVVRRPKDQ